VGRYECSGAEAARDGVSGNWLLMRECLSVGIAGFVEDGLLWLLRKLLAVKK
jgi:hypothetical protein